MGLFAAKTIFLAPAPPDPKKLAKEPGAVYTMKDPFVVNLADGGSTPHFAKVGVALRFSKLSEGGSCRPRASTRPRWRPTPSCATSSSPTLQSHTSGRPRRPGGRERVKKQIMTRGQQADRLKITDVYYTEFAVQ